MPFELVRYTSYTIKVKQTLSEENKSRASLLLLATQLPQRFFFGKSFLILDAYVMNTSIFLGKAHMLIVVYGKKNIMVLHLLQRTKNVTREVYPHAL